MSMLLVAIGGFFGAIARYAIGNGVKLYYKGTFPYATLFINVMGALLLGMLLGAEIRKEGYLLLGTGFMGAFTTFSTFNLESIQLLKEKKTSAIVYLLISYIVGISFASLGFFFGTTMK